MKYLSIIKYVLLAVSLVLVAVFLFVGDTTKETGVNDPWLGLMMNWTYLLFGLALILAIVFPLIYMIQHPKGAVQSLIGLAIVAIVIGISYAVSSDAPIVTPVAVYDNPGLLKISDTGLYTTYVALGAAILAVIFGEIGNAFKK